MSRILIVDDEPAIGWSLGELLDDRGHAVKTAASVEEAIEICRRFTPELILLDVRLPGRDGLSAIPESLIALLALALSPVCLSSRVTPELMVEKVMLLR